MIDIHCHPLAGVDDGAESFEVSVAMCRMAAADGITHLVATPHQNYDYAFQREVNRKKLAELQAAVGPAPTLLLGCDFHLSYDNLQRLLENRADFTINNSQYVLVEFGEHFIPTQLDRVFFDLQSGGLVPILTHPERNPVFRHKPDLLPHWVGRGCLVQVTAKSYLGGFGSTIQRLSERWLDCNLVHFFASDAHNLKSRPPVLSRCYQKVAAAQGKETADRLLLENPRHVIEGKPLRLQPTPLELSGNNQGDHWWAFWRRRK
jgi:protein-tyrosine phosphatase